MPLKTIALHWLVEESKLYVCPSSHRTAAAATSGMKGMTVFWSWIRTSLATLTGPRSMRAAQHTLMRPHFLLHRTLLASLSLGLAMQHFGLWLAETMLLVLEELAGGLKTLAKGLWCMLEAITEDVIYSLDELRWFT